MIIGVIGVVFLVLFCITMCCCCCHHEVMMHNDARNNPLKLIWGVVVFAEKNNEHIFCSAFTYNEMPSRLDLAKLRYGGPFTAREVEDVKNFWQLVFLLLTLTGFQLKDDTTSLSVAVFETLDEVYEYGRLNYMYSPWTVTGLMIIVCIPINQLLLRLFFPKYTPRMLTRIKIRLVMVLLSLIATTVISGIFFSNLVVAQTETTYYFNKSEFSICDVDYCTGDVVANVSTSPSSFCSVLYHNWVYAQCNITNGCVYHEYFVDSFTTVYLVDDNSPSP